MPRILDELERDVEIGGLANVERRVRHHHVEALRQHGGCDIAGDDARIGNTSVLDGTRRRAHRFHVRIDQGDWCAAGEAGRRDPERACPAAQVQHMLAGVHHHRLGEQGGRLIHVVPGEDAGASEEGDLSSPHSGRVHMEDIVSQVITICDRVAGRPLGALGRDDHAVPAPRRDDDGMPEQRLERGGSTLDALVRGSGDGASPSHLRQAECVPQQLVKHQLLGRYTDGDEVGLQSARQ